MPGFVTRNEQKAFRASKAYCELLGTPWECLDARERVLRQRPPDLGGRGDLRRGGLLGRLAPGLRALGRGARVRPGRAGGREEGAVASSGASASRAPRPASSWPSGWTSRGPGRRWTALRRWRTRPTSRRRSRSPTAGWTGRRSSWRCCRRAAEPWPERRAFLGAMIALGARTSEGFRAGVAQLQKLKPDARVTRILGRLAAGDRAGRVDAGAHLRVERGAKAGAQERPIPPRPPSSPSPPASPTSAARGPPAPLETADGFATVLAHRYHGRPRPPPTPALLEAARAHAAGQDEGLRLMAVSLLVEPFLSPEQRERSRAGRRGRAGRSWPRRTPRMPFFQLAAVAGPDAETAPVEVPGARAAGGLARGGALRIPGALLRETLDRHLRPDDFRDFGLSTAVEVVLDIDLERYLERVLNEAGRTGAPGRGGADAGLAAVARAGGWCTSSAGRGSCPRSPSGPAASRTGRWRPRRSPAASGCGAAGRSSRGWAGGRRPRSRTSCGRAGSRTRWGARAVRGDGRGVTVPPRGGAPSFDEQLEEGVERHALEVLAAVAPRGHRALLHLPVAHHQGEGDLLELGLADLRVHRHPAVVQLGAEAPGAEELEHLAGVRQLAVGHGDQLHLDRCEPGGERAGVVLDEDGDEALEAAVDGAVEDDRAGARRCPRRRRPARTARGRCSRPGWCPAARCGRCCPSRGSRASGRRRRRLRGSARTRCPATSAPTRAPPRRDPRARRRRCAAAAGCRTSPRR